MNGFTKLEQADLSLLYTLPTGLVKPYLCFLEHRRLREARLTLGLLMHKTGLSHTQAREAVKALEALGLIAGDPQGGWACARRPEETREAQPSQRLPVRKPVRKPVRETVREAVRETDESAAKNPVRDAPSEEAELRERRELREPPQPPRPQPPAAPPVTLVERIERLRGSEAGALLAQGLPQEVRRKDRLGVLEQVAALYPAGLVRKALEETLPRLPGLRNPSVYLLSVVERLHAESPTPQPPSPRPRRALPAWVPPELEGHRLDEWLEAHVLARLPDAEADRAALLLKRWRADALKEPEYRMLNQLLEAGYAQRTAHAPT